MQTIPTYDELLFSQELSKYRVSDNIPIKEAPLLIENLPLTKFTLKSALSRSGSERKERLHKFYRTFSEINIEHPSERNYNGSKNVVLNSYFSSLFGNPSSVKSATPGVKRSNYSKNRGTNVALTNDMTEFRTFANENTHKGTFSLTPLKSLSIYDTRAKVERDFEKELDRELILQLRSEAQAIGKQLEDDYRDLRSKEDAYSPSGDDF